MTGNNEAVNGYKQSLIKLLERACALEADYLYPPSSLHWIPSQQGVESFAQRRICD
jgi:hypothetical protein